eukprot:7382216-Prymnesium_polylepis.1
MRAAVCREPCDRHLADILLLLVFLLDAPIAWLQNAYGFAAHLCPEPVIAESASTQPQRLSVDQWLPCCLAALAASRSSWGRCPPLGY